MDYLARESADLSVKLWEDIDETVVDTLKRYLLARKFLKVSGPYGAGASFVTLDTVEKEEVLDKGFARITGRSAVEMPLLFEDFTLLGRDLEYAGQTGFSLDLSPAIRAAKLAAQREDDLIFQGSKTLGVPGLSTARGANKIKKGDWTKSEAGYTDIAKAVALLTGKGYRGRLALTLSSDLYLALQHLASNTGLLEIERIKKLIGDNVFLNANFGANEAVLVCAEPEYMDLAIGLDFSVGYVELVDFNHHFRIMETAALRIKDPGAIVVFE